LHISSPRTIVRTTGRRLVVASPARVRDHVVGIRWNLVEDEPGEQMLNLGHTQVDARRTGRRLFFRGDCRARIAARKACA
jgi:hypothetical protein